MIATAQDWSERVAEVGKLIPSVQPSVLLPIHLSI